MTARQAAEVLHVSTDTVYRLCDKGQLRSVRYGDTAGVSRRIYSDSVTALLERGERLAREMAAK